MESKERQVVLGEIPSDTAKEALHGEKQEWDGNLLHESVPLFTEDDRYSFKSKWGIVGEDLQIQFFLPKHAKVEDARSQEAWHDYWITRFATVLDQVARKYFEAGPPRLTAKYTEELASWWFRAQGFGHMLSPKDFVGEFLDKLDAALKAKRESN